MLVRNLGHGSQGHCSLGAQGLGPQGMGEESRRCCFNAMGSSTASYRFPTQTMLSLRLCHFFTEDNLTFSEMPRYNVYNALHLEGLFFLSMYVLKQLL